MVEDPGTFRGNPKQEQSIVSAATSSGSTTDHSFRGAQPEERETLFNRVVTLEDQIAHLYKRIDEIEGAIAGNREFLNEALRELGLS